MKFRTRFTEAARAELRDIELPIARRILAKLAELEADPFGYGSKPLVGDPTSRRLRVGDWRVLYRVEQGALLVIVIHLGHRSTVYER